MRDLTLSENASPTFTVRPFPGTPEMSTGGVDSLAAAGAPFACWAVAVPASAVKARKVDPARRPLNRRFAVFKGASPLAHAERRFGLKAAFYYNRRRSVV